MPRNPYRVAFVQSVVVAETDERAELEYGRYSSTHFRQGPGSVPLHYLGLPGYVDARAASRRCCATPATSASPPS